MKKITGHRQFWIGVYSLVFGAMVSGCPHSQDDSDAGERRVEPQIRQKPVINAVSVDEINTTVAIIGKLGHPLHSLHKVECKITDMSFTRAKADDGRKALLVIAVDDKPLKEKTFIDLPPSISQEAAQVGLVHKVWAYETIVRNGYPTEAFKRLDIPAIATTNLHFSSQLIFIKEIKPDENKP